MGRYCTAYDPDARWYAVWTRSRQEKAVAAMLSSQSIRHYLPLKSELRRWTDRLQKVEVPLFSGYLFVHINSLKKSKLQVLKIPGVGALVGNQNGPVPLHDHQIEDIQKVLTAGVECSIQPFGKEGDWVRVSRGVLAGVEGTWVRTNSESRLVISIETIRQSLSVNISRSDVEVVGEDLPAVRFA
jgi:transcription antitermination factor NusG